MKKIINYFSLILCVALVFMLTCGINVSFAESVDVAKIVETGSTFTTVQAAITAAENGQTVKMIADSTENVQVGTPTDRTKVVTLDLNGKTLKSTGTVDDIRHSAINNYATLTISDSSKDGSGKITGGTGSAKAKSSFGGGVYNNGGKLTMTGGTITGNSAGQGGGVANISGGTFIMTGGIITGNTATQNGGGVINLDTFTMSVSGNAKITGNTKGTGETATVNNVYLPAGKTITVGTGSSPVKYLENGALIGVTVETPPTADTPVPVTGTNSNNYSPYFSSDNADYGVLNEGSNSSQVVKLVLHTHNWSYQDHSTDASISADTIKAACTGTIETCCSPYTTLTILKPELTTYGETGKSEKATLSAKKIGGENVSADAIKYYAKKTDGTGWETTPLSEAPKKAGTYKASITIGTGSDARTASVEYTIQKKTLTVNGTSVNNKNYNGNRNATYTKGTLSGVLPGDTVNLSVKSALFGSKNVGKDIEVIVTYELSGEDAANYITKTEKFTADIAPIQLQIFGTTVSDKTYDGTTLATATAGTVEGIVSGDSVTVIISSATFADKNVGEGKEVAITYALSGDNSVTQNYQKPEDDTRIGNIYAKSITIEADEKSTVIWNELDELTYTCATDALCAGDTIIGALSTDADKNTIGDYDITKGTLSISDGNDGENYIITFNKGTYHIGKKVVTLQADNKSMNLGEKVPVFTATIEGLVGTDQIEYTFNTIEPTDQGVYSIVPHVTEVPDDYIVTCLPGTLVVSKKEVSAKAEPKHVIAVLEKFREKPEYTGKQLDVEVRTDGDVSQADKDLIEQVVGTSKKIIFTDTDLVLIVKDNSGTTEENIGDKNDTLIAITYRFDFSEKSDIQVLRVHEKTDGAVEVEELKETPNANGESVVFEEKDGTITVYAKKYSTYAFAYNEVQEEPIPLTGDEGTWSFYLILLLLASFGLIRLKFYKHR